MSKHLPSRINFSLRCHSCGKDLEGEKIVSVSWPSAWTIFVYTESDHQICYSLRNLGEVACLKSYKSSDPALADGPDSDSSGPCRLPFDSEDDPDPGALDDARARELRYRYGDEDPDPDEVDYSGGDDGPILADDGCPGTPDPELDGSPYAGDGWPVQVEPGGGW